MDLFDVVRSCVRRWYVVLPLLLLTAWYSHHVYASVKPVYYSQAIVGLTPPNTRIDVPAAGVPVSRNGLLDVGGATFIANMYAVALRQPSVVDQVVAAGGRPDYDVKMFPVPPTMPELPLIMVEITAPTPVAAAKTMDLVMAQTKPMLKSLQQGANVPDDQMVTPFVVSPPSVPFPGVPSRTRSTVVVFAAGAGLSVLFGVIADLLLAHRHRRATDRKSRRKALSTGPQPTQDADSGSPSQTADQHQSAPIAEDATGSR